MKCHLLLIFCFWCSFSRLANLQSTDTVHLALSTRTTIWAVALQPGTSLLSGDHLQMRTVLEGASTVDHFSLSFKDNLLVYSSASSSRSLLARPIGPGDNYLKIAGGTVHSLSDITVDPRGTFTVDWLDYNVYVVRQYSRSSSIIVYRLGQPSLFQVIYRSRSAVSGGTGLVLNQGAKLLPYLAWVGGSEKSKILVARKDGTSVSTRWNSPPSLGPIHCLATSAASSNSDDADDSRLLFALSSSSSSKSSGGRKQPASNYVQFYSVNVPSSTFTEQGWQLSEGAQLEGQMATVSRRAKVTAAVRYQQTLFFILADDFEEKDDEDEDEKKKKSNKIAKKPRQRGKRVKISIKARRQALPSLDQNDHLESSDQQQQQQQFSRGHNLPDEHFDVHRLYQMPIRSGTGSASALATDQPVMLHEELHWPLTRLVVSTPPSQGASCSQLLPTCSQVCVTVAPGKAVCLCRKKAAGPAGLVGQQAGSSSEAVCEEELPPPPPPIQDHGTQLNSFQTTLKEMVAENVEQPGALIQAPEIAKGGGFGGGSAYNETTVSSSDSWIFLTGGGAALLGLLLTVGLLLYFGCCWCSSAAADDDAAAEKPKEDGAGPTASAPAEGTTTGQTAKNETTGIAEDTSFPATSEDESTLKMGRKKKKKKAKRKKKKAKRLKGTETDEQTTTTES